MYSSDSDLYDQSEDSDGSSKGFDFYDNESFDSATYEEYSTKDYFYSSAKRLSDFQHFPGKKKFAVIHARRVFTIEKKNYKDSLVSKKKPESDYYFHQSESQTMFLDRIRNPCLEQLWECMLYLSYIIHDYKNMTYEPPSVKTIPSISSDLLDTPKQWFVWCNNLYIETLQNLCNVQVSLPYDIWEKIISLTREYKYPTKIRKLTTNIEAVSQDEEKLIVEKIFIQECLRVCTNLIRNFYFLLYCPDMTGFDAKRNNTEIPKLLHVLNSNMMRFAHLLDSTPPTTNICLNYEIVNIFRADIWKDITNLNRDTEVLMSLSYLVVPLCNNSLYFVMLLENRDKIGVYNMLCVKKDDLLDSEKKLKCFMINDATYSFYRPELYCSGSLVATVSNEKTNLRQTKIWKLTIWDLQESQDKLIRYKIDDLDSCSEITNVGLTRAGKFITVILSAKLSSTRLNCMCLNFDMVTKRKNRYQVPKISNVMSNTQLLCLHENLMFAVQYKLDPKLCLINVNDEYKVLISIEWSNQDPWHVRINNNLERKTCLLYRKNDIQIRKLDKNLTFVRSVYINIDPIPVFTEPHYQFYDNIIYGHCSYSPSYDEVEKGYYESDCHKFMELRYHHIINPYYEKMRMLAFYFQCSFFIVDDHFAVDIDSEESLETVVHWDLPNQNSYLAKKLADNEGMVNWGSIYFNFTGFSSDGTLLQMSVSSEPDVGDSYWGSLCSKISAVRIQFHDSFQPIVDGTLPKIRPVLKQYHAEYQKLQDEKEKQRKRMEKIDEDYAKLGI